MSSRKKLMLIFGDWLDCVLKGIILQKKYVAIFYNHPFYFSVKFKLWSKLGQNNWILKKNGNSVVYSSDSLNIRLFYGNRGH